MAYFRDKTLTFLRTTKHIPFTTTCKVTNRTTIKSQNIDDERTIIQIKFKKIISSREKKVRHT